MFDKLAQGIVFGIVGGFLTLVIVFTLWLLLRLRSKPTQHRAPWEQMVGRTHREGQVSDEPLPNDVEERRLVMAMHAEAFLRAAKKHGFTVDREKLAKLLEPSIEDVLEKEKNGLDHADMFSGLYDPTVQVAETRADIAARQEREQQMFGDGVKRSTPEDDEN